MDSGEFLLKIIVVAAPAPLKKGLPPAPLKKGHTPKLLA